MALPEALAEVIAKSNEAVAQTLATAFQGLKFARTPKLKLSKFNGPPLKAGDSTLTDWLEELDFYCRQLELADHEKVDVAIDDLGGAAKDEIVCCPPEEIDTLPKLIVVLSRKFSAPANVAALTGELYARVQREGETLAEFSRAVMLIHDGMERTADAPEKAAHVLELFPESEEKEYI